MQNFPNIIYNIKDQKYDQFGVFQWMKYKTFFYPDIWINRFELFIKNKGKKNE